MATNTTTFRHFLPVIKALPPQNPLSNSAARKALTISEEGSLSILYAPFEHMPSNPRIVVVGITPGVAQAEAALLEARRLLSLGYSDEDVLHSAKLTASFSGTQTRSNLVSMLDAIGVSGLFGVESTAKLFTPGSEHVHFTSALRNPVFVNGTNYNGSPHMIRTPALRSVIETSLAEEARALPGALWLPLGPKPAVALEHLVANGILSPDRVLSGIPHPSGLNGERVAAFLGRITTASAKTNVSKLLDAREMLTARISSLVGGMA